MTAVYDPSMEEWWEEIKQLSDEQISIRCVTSVENLRKMGLLVSIYAENSAFAKNQDDQKKSAYFFLFYEK